MMMTMMMMMFGEMNEYILVLLLMCFCVSKYLCLKPSAVCFIWWRVGKRKPEYICYVCFLIMYSQTYNWQCWHPLISLPAFFREFCMVWSMPYWYTDWSVLLGSLLMDTVYAWGCCLPTVNLYSWVLVRVWTHQIGQDRLIQDSSSLTVLELKLQMSVVLTQMRKWRSARQVQFDTECSMTDHMPVIGSQLAALICSQEGSWGKTVADLDIAVSLIEGNNCCINLQW